MSTIIVIIHSVVAIALILIVLLQTGKGADMGAAFGGGGSQTLFGSTGASTFLSRLTTIAAIVFMLTSLGLAYLSSHRSAKSIMSEIAVPAAEQAGQSVPGAPVEAGEAPVEAPAPPVAEEAEAVKATPEQTGETQAAQEAGGEG